MVSIPLWHYKCIDILLGLHGRKHLQAQIQPERTPESPKHASKPGSGAPKPLKHPKPEIRSGFGAVDLVWLQVSGMLAHVQILGAAILHAYTLSLSDTG